MVTRPAPSGEPPPRTGPVPAERLLTAGRCFSWIVLLGIPAVSLAVVVAALFGSVDLDPMWMTSSLILACVFLHGVYYVRRDEASRRAG